MEIVAQRLAASAILTVNIFLICLSLYLSNLFERLGYSKGWLLGWDILTVSINITITLSSFFFFRVLCPEIYCKSAAKVRAIRAKPCLGLTGPRKLIIVASYCFMFVFLAGGTAALYKKYTGANGASFRPTEAYEAGTENASEFDLTAAALKAALILGNVFHEEVAIRCLALAILLYLMSETSSIALSSLIFGLLHVPARVHYPVEQAFALVLPAIVCGFGLAIAYLRVGLWFSVLMHFLINAVSGFPDEPPSSWVGNIVVLVLFVLFPCVLLELFFKHSGSYSCVQSLLKLSGKERLEGGASMSGSETLDTVARQQPSS